MTLESTETGDAHPEPMENHTRNLQAENTRLHRQVEDFMTQARQNERKLRRFQSLELRLIGITSLYELIELVLYPDYSTFRWDVVTLLLLDPEYEIQRVLEGEGVEPSEHPTLMFATEHDRLQTLFPASMFPMLGPFRPRQHASLFPKPRRAPATVMLLPLVRRGTLIGSLNIGSYSKDRFVKGVRSDFFDHLAAVVAICLENAVNLERLKRQGLTDTLTAVNNRRFFDQRLGEEIEAAKRDGLPLSCLLLDVDHFKRVNDRHGHQVGDHVLMEVAALIRAQLRGNDVLARYGGEEFGALLAHTSNEKAAEVAERVRTDIAQREFGLPGGGCFTVTISIGVATFDPACDKRGERIHGEELIGHADKALYTAKAAGRNRVVSAGDVCVQEGMELYA